MYRTLIASDTLLDNLANPDWVIVDCRSSLADLDYGRRVYSESHIPGAVYANLEKDLSGPIVPGHTGRHPLPDIAVLAAKLSAWGIGTGVQVVVYDDRSGGIAARLWWMLRWLGHQAVAVLDGGWQDWNGCGFPTTQAVPVSVPREFHPQPRPEMLADLEEVDDIRQDEHYKLVDSREQIRYEGKHEPIDPVAGHIPGAVNLPFANHVEAGGRLASPDAIRKQWEGVLGDTPPEQTVVYCGSGVTACFNLLTMAHAGLEGAKLYPGSWSEWIADPKRPVGTKNH
ncbi:MAG: sulfurtransferase [Saprospiraceae bacterium]|nr:sulfurtransferase [Saprospiraceae bacterium]